MKNIIFIFLFFLLNNSIFTQSIYTETDREICKNKFEFAVANSLSEKPINEVVIEIAKTFLNLDYEAYTLEKGENEQLVIHLTGLDCYTFFESSLGFARCIKKGKTSFEDFQNEIRQIRYRDGIINQYPSRLHYASDWLFDNNKRGIVKDITEELGGELYKKEINFMSTHSDNYKQLKENKIFNEAIKKIEYDINLRNYFYIPQNSITEVEDKLKSGDIILITASTDGLDISHTGMAIRMDDGRIHFLHAPLASKKIEITKQPLSDYIINSKRHTGIMVARVLEPNLD